MKPRLILLTLLYGLLTSSLFAWDNEEAFRNELSIARSAVSNMTARVADSEKEVAAKQKIVDDINAKITDANGRKAKIQEWIGIKSQAKELVTAQLKRKIALLEAELQKAADENKPSEVLVNIQRRTNAYRKDLRDTLARYNYDEDIARLRNALNAVNREITGLANSLREPLAQLGDAEHFLQQERDTLNKSIAKLNELRLKAPEQFKNISPPYLERLAVYQGEKKLYEAKWEDATDEVDKRIAILKEALKQQEREIAAHKRNIDSMSDTIVEQNRICDRLMEEYTDALWWQAMKSIYVELVSSAVNIALDFKSMGPYAFLVEAIDVTQKSLRGELTANYGLPKGAFEQPTLAGSTASRLQKESWSKFGPKGHIKDTLKNTIKELAGGKKLADGITSRNLGTEYLSGTMTRTFMNEPINSVADLKNVLRGRHLLSRGGRVALSEVKDTFTKVMTPSRLIETTKTNIKKVLTDREQLASFGVKVAVGVAKDFAKSAAEEERIQSWFRYAEADAQRSAMLVNFKAVALARDFDTYMLELMNEHMDELLDERDKAQARRTLNVIVSEKLEPGNTFTIKMDFTQRLIQVDSVTLGGLPVTITERNGAFITGTIDLQQKPAHGEISVTAKDRDSEKLLDNPATKAIIDTESGQWNFYEPGPDDHHRVVFGDLKPKRSIVFLIDCSGSMGNGRLTKAIAAANAMFDSGKFKETDELSLWIFRGGAISRPVPFTLNHQAVRESINALTPGGGTPLAQAIRMSGEYLSFNGLGEYKAMVVLTDGEAGGVAEAIQYVRSLDQNIDLNL